MVEPGQRIGAEHVTTGKMLLATGCGPVRAIGMLAEHLLLKMCGDNEPDELLAGNRVSVIIRIAAPEEPCSPD